MTTLASFYDTCRALPPAQRRWCAGAAHLISAGVRRGESYDAVQARILTVPQYAKGLTDAGLVAAFNAIDSGVQIETPLPSVFFRDTFSEPGVDLGSHISDSEHPWARNTTYSTSASISTAGRARTNTATATGYYANVIPPSPDYKVEGDFVVMSTSASGSTGIAGRMNSSVNTMYAARYNWVSGGWDVLKLVGGTATVIRAVVPFSLVVGNTYRVGLLMDGDQISMTVDGALVHAPIGDTAIVGAGRPGLRLGDSSVGNAAGIHVDNLIATEIL